MDASVSPKDEIWFLRVCRHISTGLYIKIAETTQSLLGRRRTWGCNPVRDFTPVGSLSECIGRSSGAFEGSYSEVKMQQGTFEAGLLGGISSGERVQYRLVHIQKGQFFMSWPGSGQLSWWRCNSRETSLPSLISHAIYQIPPDLINKRAVTEPG